MGTESIATAKEIPIPQGRSSAFATAIRTGKEAGRHARHLLGFGQRASHLKEAKLRDRFDKIYRDGIWQMGAPDVPLSGNGSTVFAAANVMTKLPTLMRSLGCKSLLDVGCGDMTWMHSVDVPGYAGVDIVSAIVAENQRKFPDRHFLCLDAVVDPLPRADAAICREVLFHLSFSDAIGLLRNIRAAGVRWLLATTDTQTMFNSDIASADFRMLNLRRAPFRFPKPETEIEDDVIASGRSIAAWKISDLPL
jgi:hypothetical protein